MAPALLVLCACFARPLWVADWSGPLDRMDEAALASLARAHALAGEGDPATAALLLEALARDNPGNLPVGIALQEARLTREQEENRDQGGAADDVRRVGGLAEAQAEAARATPSVVALLLAARLTVDEEEAERLVEGARSLGDEDAEAWTLYVDAHLLLSRGGAWDDARRMVARALQADPGHVPSRRLEAWMMARDGDAGQAAQLLVAWLGAVGDDPRVAPDARRLVRLDLARCLILDGEPEDALSILEAGGPWGDGAFMRHLLRAAALHGSGDGAGALRAVQAAAVLEPEALLPHIQEALLLEASSGDPGRATPSWQRVIELSREVVGFGQLLDTLRARVRLERASRAAPGQEGNPAAPNVPEAVVPDEGGGARL